MSPLVDLRPRPASGPAPPGPPARTGPWPAWELWLTPKEWDELGRDEPAVDLALGVLQDPVASVTIATRVGHESAASAETTHSTIAIRSGLGVHLGLIRRQDRAAVRLAAFDISTLDEELTGAVPTTRANPDRGVDLAGDPAVRHTARYTYPSLVAGLRATTLGPEVLREVALDVHRAGGPAPDRICAQLEHLSKAWCGSLTALVRQGGVPVRLAVWVLTSSGWFALEAAAEPGDECDLVVRPVAAGDLVTALSGRGAHTLR